MKEATVLPQFMSPFKRIEDDERRSILRKRGRSESHFSTPPESAGDSSPLIPHQQQKRFAETSPRRSHGRKKKKLVQFSPYNRVQLISPRRAGDNEHVRQLYESIREGRYEDSEDEGEEWSRTVSNNSETPEEDSVDSTSPSD